MNNPCNIATSVTCVSITWFSHNTWLIGSCNMSRYGIDQGVSLGLWLREILSPTISSCNTAATHHRSVFLFLCHDVSNRVEGSSWKGFLQAEIYSPPYVPYHSTSNTSRGSHLSIDLFQQAVDILARLNAKEPADYGKSMHNMWLY